MKDKKHAGEKPQMSAPKAGARQYWVAVPEGVEYLIDAETWDAHSGALRLYVGDRCVAMFRDWKSVRDAVESET